MIGGIAISIIAVAVGAILDFAVTVSPDQHGFNIHNVGVILMIVGAIGAILSIVAAISMGGGNGFRRHRTIVDDGRGNVVHREDTYT